MAGNLSAEKKKAFKEAFDLFDKNGDGKISKDEVRTVLLKLHRDPTEADLESFLSKVDTNKSGFIEYAEFEQMLIEQEALAEARLKEAFGLIDTDGSGFISLGEMNSLFKSLGLVLTADELKTEMEKVDLDKDGKISLDEFKTMMSKI